MIEGHGDNAKDYGTQVRADFSSNVWLGLQPQGLKNYLREQLSCIALMTVLVVVFTVLNIAIGTIGIPLDDTLRILAVLLCSLAWLSLTSVAPSGRRATTAFSCLPACSRAVRSPSFATS